MSGQFAKDTSVSPERSVAEIQAILKRYGATRFGFIEDADKVAVAFEMKDRRVRFELPIPKRTDVARTESGRARKGAAIQSAHEQAIRQRYRALVLTIKAKLESVEAGIETFEDAFMAHLVLPDGRTMGQWAKPQIETMYLSGTMPPLLGSGN